MHAELPLASFICALLVIVPLPWHWRAGTIPTISIILWLFVVNIINGVNTIVWADNVVKRIPVWCDIVTKVIIGGNLALPSSLLRLCVHLERISSVRAVGETLEQKRWRQGLDWLFCLGLPVIYMALHVVVQGHRFDIIENFGCNPTTYSSLAAIFIIYLPPLICAFGSCVLSAMAFRNFYIRRLTFARHLRNASASLTPSRYFRLMALAIVQMFWCIAITIAKTVFSVRSGLRPYKSWAFVHSNWTAVGQFPAILIPHYTLVQTYLLWWSVPVSAFLFFIFFSFGQDAMAEYRACVAWVRRVVLRMPEVEAKKRAFLPSFIKQDFGSGSKAEEKKESKGGLRPFRLLQSGLSGWRRADSTDCLPSPPPAYVSNDKDSLGLPVSAKGVFPPPSKGVFVSTTTATTDLTSSGFTSSGFGSTQGVGLPSSPSSSFSGPSTPTAPSYSTPSTPHSSTYPSMPPALDAVPPVPQITTRPPTPAFVTPAARSSSLPPAARELRLAPSERSLAPSSQAVDASFHSLASSPSAQDLHTARSTQSLAPSSHSLRPAPSSQSLAPSTHSLATSLSTRSARDVIFIYDAYGDDESRPASREVDVPTDAGGDDEDDVEAGDVTSASSSGATHRNAGPSTADHYAFRGSVRAYELPPFSDLAPSRASMSSTCPAFNTSTSDTVPPRRGRRAHTPLPPLFTGVSVRREEDMV